MFSIDTSGERVAFAGILVGVVGDTALPALLVRAQEVYERTWQFGVVIPCRVVSDDYGSHERSESDVREVGFLGVGYFVGGGDDLVEGRD